MSETPYDALPYTNHPYNFSHPDHLYTIARLFGMDAPDYRTARVLELGCGAGGNALSIADRFPECRVVGVDLSKVHIQRGEALRAGAGIRNLTLDHASILDLPAAVSDDLGEFDYIVSHGVYSWIPAEARDRLLAVCGGHLAPGGVAFVSYNTLPGWNMVRTLRDMMLYHTAHIDDPKEKAEEGARLLAFVREGQAGSQAAYAGFLEEELAVLEGKPLAYFAHDHLGAENEPCYLHEFVTAARGKGLQYLGDGDLQTMYVGNLRTELAKALSSAGDIVRTEQYMDFLRNRRFRKTLLCREGEKLQRHLAPEIVRPFHLLGRVHPTTPEDEIDLRTDQEVSFESGPISLTSRCRFHTALLLGLAEKQGRAVGREEWIEDVRRRTGADDASQFAADLDATVLALALSGGVQLAQPHDNYVASISERPLCSPLAREQVRQQDWASNRRGEPVGMSPGERVLLQYLDGERALADLAKCMRSHLDSGELTLHEDGERVEGEARIDVLLSAMLREGLGRAGRHALLVA